jgi:hypothetical protein
MIVEIPQPICCRFSMKSEIPRDQAAPGARAPARRGQALDKATTGPDVYLGLLVR